MGGNVEIEQKSSTSNDGDGDETMMMMNKVEITVKSIGPSPSFRLRVPSPVKVHDLRKLIACNGQRPMENMKLILRGNVLQDSQDGDDKYLKLKDGDSIIVAVKPKPPAKHVRNGSDDDDDDSDDDMKFQLPQSANRWQRKFFSFLRDKLKLPHMLLTAIYALSLKMWIIITIWFILAPVANRYDLGPLYILATGFALIFLNLGKRRHGDVSAYSIFNEDFRELPGTLNADRLDRDIRAGQF